MVDNMYDIYMLDSECGKIRKFESSHFCFVKANMGPQEGSPYIMSQSLFGSVVAGTFQITFRAKMHANNVFLFFKNHF